MGSIKINLKSNKGFTMQDLLIACFIITLFVGIISTMMFSAYKTNMTANLMSQMTMYAVQILEDIDKISYEDVQSKTEQEYRTQFQIPAGFGIDIQISNYGEGVENIQDLIKIVKLTISYSFQGNTEELTINRLKIKEI